MLSAATSDFNESATAKGREFGRDDYVNPNPEQATQGAIRAGLVRSVDKFTESEVQALLRPKATFDAEAARLEAVRIREVRNGDARPHIGCKY